MKSKFLSIMTALALLSMTVISPAFADENEVVELRQLVKDLTAKVSGLESKVGTMEGHITEAKAGKGLAPITPAAEQPGGLIHTMQDIHMGGYIDVQYNQNLMAQTSNNGAGVAPSVNGGTPGGNPLRSFDNDQDTFTMNAAVLEFQKAPNAEGGVGFRADVMMGQNAELINLSTTGSNPDQFTFLQAYVDIVAPLSIFKDNPIFDDTIDIKVGRLLTLAGWEVVRSPDNWNTSRGLLFGLGQPITHTGARATYNLFNDKVTTYWGVLNGWDSVVDNNQQKTWETGFSWSPFDALSWTSAFYYGPENARQGGHRRFLMTNVALFKVTDKLSVVGEIDFGNENRVVGLQSSNGIDQRDAQWHGYYAGARYQLNNKLAGAYRIELFRDDDLFRAGHTDGLAAVDHNTLWEQTFTLEYNIYDNLIGRLEYRLDRSDDINIFNGEAAQQTIGAQLIYNFA